MSNCIWECLKWALGFWGAVAVLGLLLTGLAALTVSTGGTGGAVAVPLLEALLASALGSAGIKIAIAGGTGIIGSLIGCISTCVIKHA